MTTTVLDELIEISEPVVGFNQDKSIRPGYFGPPDVDPTSPHPTTDSLEVIVWNEIVSAKMVGAYKSCFSFLSNGKWTGNFKKDYGSKWTTEDLKLDRITKIAKKII